MIIFTVDPQVILKMAELLEGLGTDVASVRSDSGVDQQMSGKFGWKIESL